MMASRPHSHNKRCRSTWPAWSFALLATLVLTASGPLTVSPALTQTLGAPQPAPVGTTTQFRLENGLRLLVVEDHRLPVVTHMVWYKAGSIDDPQGASGLAHLLEHLMFKSYDAMSDEPFAETMSRLGAIDNARTGHDWTYYYQRVAREFLQPVMQIEAVRMSGLVLEARQVETERMVVREERRSNVESSPIKLLAEQLYATLYQNHSYARPPLGWSHEVVTLTQAQARDFYDRFYDPGNAIVVIAGDVRPKDVLRLAEVTYGQIRARPRPQARTLTKVPEPIAARRVALRDGRTPRPTLFRYYLTPSFATAQPGDAESIEMLATILGNGVTSRLHQELVTGRKLAIAVGARYFSKARDAGHLAIFGLLANEEGLGAFEDALDGVLAVVARDGVTDDELARAKAQYEAKTVFGRDNQMTLAVRYGEALTAGLSIKDVQERQARINAVSVDDVQKAAAKYLALKRSVTGVLLPEKRGGSSQ